MQRSTDRILTTHVGSLIRPDLIRRHLRAKQKGEGYDAAAHAANLKETVAEVVRQQAEAGVDVVSDGEFGKGISWSQYAIERVSGFERRPFNPAPAIRSPSGADRERFTEFYTGARRARITSRRVTDTVAVGADQIHRAGAAPAGHRQLQSGAEGREGGRGLPAGRGAGQSVIPDRKNEYYKSDDDLAEAIGRGDARGIQADRRQRLPGAARRRARRRHLRPHGAAGELPGLSQVASRALIRT